MKLRRKPSFPILIAMAVLLWTTSTWAETEHDEETEHHEETALLNPLGTLLGATATGFDVPVVSLNGRYQRAYNPQWALSIAPQLVYADVLSFQHYLLGVKVGPRYSLSERYLEGWYVSPMLLLGFTFSRQFGEHAQSAFVLGLGADAGYAWHWKHWVVELGAGLHLSKLVGHSSELRGEDGKVPGVTLGPILNFSVGYGW